MLVQVFVLTIPVWILLFVVDENRAAFPAIFFGILLFASAFLSNTKNLISEVKLLSIPRIALILAIPISIYALGRDVRAVFVIPMGMSLMLLASVISDYVKRKSVDQRDR
jgi:hypothetical protein